MFLSKAFSMSELDIQQLSKFINTTKTSRVVDRWCWCMLYYFYIVWKYRMLNNFVDKTEGEHKQRRVLPDLLTMFLFRRVNSDSVISKKIMEVPLKPQFKIRSIASITVLNLTKNTKSRLFRLSFNRLIWLLILQYTKRKQKK